MTPAERDTLEAMRRIGRPASASDIAKAAGYSETRVRAVLRRHCVRVRPAHARTSAPALWALRRRLNPTQEAVLLTLAERIGRPATSLEVAAVSGIARRTVERVLREVAYRAGYDSRPWHTGKHATLWWLW